MSWTRIFTKVWAHVEIMRPYTVAYAGLLALAGASANSQTRMPTARALRTALVTMCGWIAGHYVGDYFDREIDARSKPARPVPSGRVMPREALVSMVVLILCGNAAALSLGVRSLMLAIVTTALGLAYSKVFKGRALLGNLDRGVLGACAVAFGGLAASREASPAAIILGLATICHDSATNLVGAVRDVEGDRAAGCRTVPVVYGVARSVRVARVFAGLGWISHIAALALNKPSRFAWSLISVASALDFVVYLPLLASSGNVPRSRALAAHKVLVLERLLVTGAIIAARAPRLAFVLMTITAPVSLAFQAVMRDRHEQQAADLLKVQRA